MKVLDLQGKNARKDSKIKIRRYSMTPTQIKNIAKLISEDPKLVAILTKNGNVSSETKTEESSKVPSSNQGE